MVEDREPDGRGHAGPESLESVQGRIVDRALIMVVALFTPIVAASVARSVDVGWRLGFTLQVSTILFGWVVVLLRNELSTGVRGGIILFTVWGAGCGALFEFGLLGQSIPLFLLATVLATVFRGARAGLVVVAASLTIGAVAAVVAATYGLPRGIAPQDYIRFTSTWVLYFAMLACLPSAAVFTLGVARELLRRNTLSLALRTSELEEANATLHISEERHRLFVQNFPGIAYQLDPTNLEALILSGRLEEITGYTEADFRSGQVHWEGLVYPDDRPLVASEAAKLASTPGYRAEREYRIRRKDGQLRWVLDTAESTTTGGLRGLIQGTVYDITDRKKDRERLQTYADIVRNMQVGLYVYYLEDPEDDSSLMLTSANPASTTELGLAEQDMIGKRIDEIFPGLRERGIPQRFAEVALGGGSFIMDDFAYGDVRVEPRYFSFRVFHVPERSVGVLFEDTTARREAELALRRSEEEKRQFYRETISSVTDGRLQIVGSEESRYYFSLAEFRAPVTDHAEAVVVRRMVENYCREHRLAGDSMVMFITGVGEAMNNAIKHAGGGVVFAGAGVDTVWVGISDHGPGIATLTLPSATLRRGYSTRVSMGMGYSIMLEVADRIVLSTGSEGTTVVLVKGLVQKSNCTALEDLPDIWSTVEP